MSHRPALLIVNGRSRRGAGAAETVTRVLRESGVPIIARDCERASDLSALISATKGEIESMIIGGGDGTLNAALPGLLETGLPLGIIPLGTANDLARTLGIPTDLAAAARIIACGKVQSVDVGEVNGHPFFNVASIGFGVDLTRALTSNSKRRFGSYRLCYRRSAGCVTAAAVPCRDHARPYHPPLPHHPRRRWQRPPLRWRHDGIGTRTHRRRLFAHLQPRSGLVMASASAASSPSQRSPRRLERDSLAGRRGNRSPHASSSPLGQYRWRNRHADAGALPRPRPCDQRVYPMIA